MPRIGETSKSKAKNNEADDVNPWAEAKWDDFIGACMMRGLKNKNCDCDSCRIARRITRERRAYWNKVSAAAKRYFKFI